MLLWNGCIDKGAEYNEEERINHVRGKYESYYGTIISEWTADNGKMCSYHTEIPANTSAILYLPVEEMEVSCPDVVKFMGITKHKRETVLQFNLVSGAYDFIVIDGSLKVVISDDYN